MQIVGLLDIFTLILTSQPLETETARAWIKVIMNFHQPGGYSQVACIVIYSFGLTGVSISDVLPQNVSTGL